MLEAAASLAFCYNVEHEILLMWKACNLFIINELVNRQSGEQTVIAEWLNSFMCAVSSCLNYLPLHKSWRSHIVPELTIKIQLCLYWEDYH
jgi:hypothetical protein